MEKIKVAHVITLLELGGAQQNTLFTVRHLDRTRFAVQLICGEGAFLDEEAKKIPNLSTVFLKNMVRPIRPLKDFLCFMELMNVLKKEKPHIVHTHSSKAGILARAAAICSGVPVVIHSIHGFGFNPYQNFFIKWLFIVLEKWIAKKTDCLIAVSNDTIETGLRLGIGTKERYRLIRSGVDIQKIKEMAASTNSENIRRELKIAGDAKVILNVGPFKIQKNPLAFVRMAAEVAQKFSKAEFIMAGDGELRGKIEHLIRQLGLEDKVRLLGWRQDIPQLLKACDIFVMTSLWEGLPRAAVESLIAGKPVLAFAADGLRDIIKNGKNGFLISNNSVRELSDRVIQLLGDPNLAKQLSGNAAGSIDNSFDIHQMVRQQEELYIDKMKMS